MRLHRQSTGQPIVLHPSSLLGAGGEARVYAVMQDAALAAKIYHQPTAAQGRKIAAMLANPPDDPASERESLAIAWPRDLLLDRHTAAGFLMPRVVGMSPMFHFYNPSTRRQQFPLSNWLYLHRTARNLAAAVRALHARGYVIGDVNESNILVTETALVTLVDTDSFQVRDPITGELFRCPVGKIEFTPPELQGRTFSEVDRLPEHDLFGLAVLIFQLLLEGTHPFAGVYQGTGDPPPYEDRIAAGHFPHGTKTVPYRSMPHAPPFAILHPPLQRLFLRCFADGHTDPKARPTAEEWRDALTAAEEALVSCPVNAQHKYDTHLAACPWCERARNLGGRDPFPSPQAVRQGSHRIPAPRKALPVAVAPRTPYNLPVPVRPVRPAVTAGSGAYPAAPAVFAPFGSTSGRLSYSAPPASAPIPTIAVNNVWAAISVVAAAAAIIPGMNLIAGVSALVCGVVGLVHAKRKGVGGVILAGTGIGLALVMLALPFILRPPPGVLTEAGKGVLAVAYAPDGKMLAVGTSRSDFGSSDGGSVRLWDVPQEQPVATGGGWHSGDVVALAYSRQGMLAVGSGGSLESGHVSVLEGQAGAVRWTRTAHQNTIAAVAFSPDGKILATGGSRQEARVKGVVAEIKLWDAATGELLKTLEGEGEAFAAAFSPDGTKIAAGTGSSGSSGETGRIQVWDIGTGSLLWAHEAHSTGTLAVAFSPDGMTLASGGCDNAARIWDAKTGTVRRTLEGGSIRITALAFSPDGQTLATGGGDKLITLWNVTTGTKRKEIAGHEAEIRALTFSPDGSTLASGSLDSTARLWKIVP